MTAFLRRARQADDEAGAEVACDLDRKASDAPAAAGTTTASPGATQATSRSMSIAVVPATPRPHATSAGVFGGSGTRCGPPRSRPQRSRPTRPHRRTRRPTCPRQDCRRWREGLDGPRDLAAGRVGKRCRERVDVAAPSHHVRKVDRRRLDADADLTGTGIGRRDVVEGEVASGTGGNEHGRASMAVESGGGAARAAALLLRRPVAGERTALCSRA